MTDPHPYIPVAHCVLAPSRPIILYVEMHPAAARDQQRYCTVVTRTEARLKKDAYSIFGKPE